MCKDNSKMENQWASGNIKPTVSWGTNVCAFLLTTSTMYIVNNYHYTNDKLGGSWLKWFELIMEKGPGGAFVHTFPPLEEIQRGMTCAFAFMAVQLLFMATIPGPLHKGPVSPSGWVPTYKANGTACFLTTAVLWAAGAAAGLWNAGIFYDIFGGMIAGMNVFSVFFTLFLYLKGIYFPSTPDAGATGTFVFDFFWGTELYPRVGHWLWNLGFDLKLFTNCRWGMMFWGVSVMSYAAKQYELYGYVSSSMLVSAVTQVVYVLKFFRWEMGYMHTMDIQHDRAGFYICWGCLVWVPLLYTGHTLFLTSNPFDLGTPVTVALTVLGVLGVWVNYDADAQKLSFRAADGEMMIWGRPAKKIVAPYTTAKGEKKTNLLLASGWWGVSRHFHYIPELTAAFVWCFPALMGGTWAAFSYFPFLFILLTTRAVRDDQRCASKYGEAWTKYCEAVPYKMIPYIF